MAAAPTTTSLALYHPVSSTRQQLERVRQAPGELLGLMQSGSLTPYEMERVRPLLPVVLLSERIVNRPPVNSPEWFGHVRAYIAEAMVFFQQPFRVQTVIKAPIYIEDITVSYTHLTLPTKRIV